ncbi:hypothetical protein [uncultured Sphingobacterium sp.]|uniref:hypothetical protein n=1 Tax=uncultured Sphingobacterium sp. TaxID=182688 RepID=UPI0025FBB17F|nr:hypothetical protein [uncultured Sphingobacterium sp.]
MDKTDLFDALLMKKISEEEFINEYFKSTTLNDFYVLNMIDTAIVNKNNIAVEEAILLLNTGYFSLFNFSKKLCELLMHSWHVKHEEIAMILQGLADPRAVDSLYNAAELQFSYLDFDDTYQFARKCIKAISRVNDANAISKLKLLAKSKVIEISNYAEKELRYKGLL